MLHGCTAETCMCRPVAPKIDVLHARRTRLGLLGVWKFIVDAVSGCNAQRRLRQ